MINVNTLIKITSNTYIYTVYLLPKIHSKICVLKITRSSSKKINHINENVNALLYFYSQIAKPLLLVLFFFFFFFILCCVLLLAEKSLANSRIPGCRAKARY